MKPHCRPTTATAPPIVAKPAELCRVCVFFGVVASLFVARRTPERGLSPASALLPCVYRPHYPAPSYASLQTWNIVRTLSLRPARSVSDSVSPVTEKSQPLPERAPHRFGRPAQRPPSSPEPSRNVTDGIPWRACDFIRHSYRLRLRSCCALVVDQHGDRRSRRSWEGDNASVGQRSKNSHGSPKKGIITLSMR